MAELAVVGLLAGTEAITAATVLTAVGQVGMAMSIVGTVTGNKELSKIGGTLGVIGGIGGLAAGAITSAADAAATSAAWSDSSAALDTLSASGIDAANQGVNATLSTGVTDAATAQAGSDSLSSQLNQQALNQAQPVGQSTIANNPSNAMPGQTVANPLDNSAVQTAAESGISNPMSNASNTPYDSAGANNPSAWNGNAQQRVANDYLGTQKVDSGNWFSSMFKNAKPDTLLNLAGNTLGGVAKGYEADRNYQLGKDRLGLIQQQMAYGNSTPRYNFKA